MNNRFVLIIGAMKCGTTSLFHYLAEHPQVAPAKDKEPHFFSYNHNFKKGISRYQSLWDWQPENLMAMEASTTYTMHPKYLNVPERIASVKNADFRFIYIIRNPFDRIESHIIHLLSGGHQKKIELLEEHLAFSEYARQLDLYTKIFGRDKIHILLLEDLQANPHTELRKICQFLNIDPDYRFQGLNLVMNSKKTLNLHPTLRRIYQAPMIKSIGQRIPPEIRQKFYKPLSRQQSYIVQLSQADKTKIIERLQPDFIRLEIEYKIDIQTQWNLPNYQLT